MNIQFDESRESRELRELIICYREAIDILEEIREDDNWELAEKLIVSMAKNAPDILVANYRNVKYNNKDNEVLKEVTNLIKSDRFIEAIKYYRNAKNVNIKEATAYCNEIRERVREHEGYI